MATRTEARGSRVISRPTENRPAGVTNYQKWKRNAALAVKDTVYPARLLHRAGDNIADGVFGPWGFNHPETNRRLKEPYWK